MSNSDVVLSVAMLEAIDLNQHTNKYIDIVVFFNHCIYIGFFIQSVRLSAPLLITLSSLDQNTFQIFQIRVKIINIIIFMNFPNIEFYR
jgi:hypothetical protein